MITLARARSRTRHRCVAAGQLPLIATLPGPCSVKQPPQRPRRTPSVVVKST